MAAYFFAVSPQKSSGKYHRLRYIFFFTSEGLCVRNMKSMVGRGLRFLCWAAGGASGSETELWSLLFCELGAAAAEGFLFFSSPSNVVYELFSNTGTAPFVWCHVHTVYTKHSNSSALSCALTGKARARRGGLPACPPLCSPTKFSDMSKCYLP